MASEERFLWLFTYEVNGVNCLWWFYSYSQQETTRCIKLMTNFYTSIKPIELRECQDGLVIAHQHYQYKLSDQQRRYGRVPKQHLVARIVGEIYYVALPLPRTQQRKPRRQLPRGIARASQLLSGVWVTGL